jgi:hypothetical protein
MYCAYMNYRYVMQYVHLIDKPNAQGYNLATLFLVVPKVMSNFFFCMQPGNSRRKRVRW